jgi:hypothetical protein
MGAMPYWQQQESTYASAVQPWRKGNISLTTGAAVPPVPLMPLLTTPLHWASHRPLYKVQTLCTGATRVHTPQTAP